MKTKNLTTLIACSLALVAGSAFANDKDVAGKMKKMDTDGDGRISQAEYTAGKQHKFDKLDTNNDGVVSADEKAAKSDKKSWWNRGDKKNKVEKSDMNNDGQLTATEQDASAVSSFSKLDTNGDGYLTAVELEAAHDVKRSK